MTETDDGTQFPDWWYRLTPLTCDSHRGPDAQYRAGARDMLTVLREYPELERTNDAV